MLNGGIEHRGVTAGDQAYVYVWYRYDSVSMLLRFNAVKGASVR